MEPTKNLTLFGEVGKIKETHDECGCVHEVTYVVTKKVTYTGEKRIHDNGYTKDWTALYADFQGRLYHSKPSIDYWGGGLFMRDEDKKWFRSSKPRGLVRHLNGQGIDGTPNGPSWKD